MRLVIVLATINLLTTFSQSQENVLHTYLTTMFMVMIMTLKTTIVTHFLRFLPFLTVSIFIMTFFTATLKTLDMGLEKRVSFSCGKIVTCNDSI